MCENNSRENDYSSGFSPLHNCGDLIGNLSALGYYSYTNDGNNKKKDKWN